jgi:hypothetical protein
MIAADPRLANDDRGEVADDQPFEHRGFEREWRIVWYCASVVGDSVACWLV